VSPRLCLVTTTFSPHLHFESSWTPPQIMGPQPQPHPSLNNREPFHESVCFGHVCSSLLKRFSSNESNVGCFFYTDTKLYVFFCYCVKVGSLSPACVLCRRAGLLLNSAAGSTWFGELKPSSVFPQHNMPLRTDRFQNSLFFV